jgi:hypothetical protein
VDYLIGEIMELTDILTEHNNAIEAAVAARDTIRSMAASIIPDDIHYTVYLREVDMFFTTSLLDVWLRFYTEDRKLIKRLDTNDIDKNGAIIENALRVWKSWN